MRAFIAIHVDTETALALISARDQILATVPGSRPRAVPAANFHMTLAFLGNIDAVQVDFLGELLDRVAAETRVFRQPLSWIGSFPGPAGRVLAAQGRITRELASLHQRLNGPLRQEGFIAAVSGSFRPHVTLARLALPVVPPVRHACALQLPVTTLELCESVQRQGRVVYRPLRRAEFA